MSELLTTISLIFIIAGPFLLIANRYRLPTIPFLIIAGVVGGFFIDETLTLELARYGIALLVFTFGVRINPTSFRPVLRDSEIAAFGQILVVGGLGFALGLLFGISTGEAIFLGIAVAFSSTIVGTALLESELRKNLLRARLAQTIQFIQDLLAIVILLLLGAGTLAVEPIATQFGFGIALLILALLTHKYLFETLGQLAGESDELLIISVVSLLVVFLAASELVGVSIVVGAFAAGLAVGHDPVEHLGLFNGVFSIRDFFVAIFFVTIGALVVVPFIELGWAASIEKLLLVTCLVVLTAVVKPLVTTAILLYNGYEARSSTLTSLSIDQVSEFALIIAIEALILGLLTQNVFDAIILAAAVTMITSSLSQHYNERIYRSLATHGLMPESHKKIDELSNITEGCVDHIIIVGYGRNGQQLTETCNEQDQPYVVIENDPALFDAISSDCDAYVFGDAMEEYTWEKANVTDARLVISTVNSDPVSYRLLSFEFDVDVILRSDNVETALDFFDDGAIYVSVSEFLASEQLIQHLQELFDGDLTPAQIREQQLSDSEEYTSTKNTNKFGVN
ncbi:cation:proton antiporter [Natrialbaceae archaeon A-CW3]